MSSAHNVIIVSAQSLHNGPFVWKCGLVGELRNRGVPVLEIRSTFPNSLQGLFDITSTTVVHLYHIEPFAMVYLLAGRCRGARIIFTVHGDIFAERSSKKGIKKLLWLPFYTLALRWANSITFPSEYLHQIVAEQMPVIRNKSHVIHNGIIVPKRISVLKREKNRDSTSLLLVTNFNHEEKARGVSLAIEAVKMLRSKYKNLSLTVVGGGRHLTHYETIYSCAYVKFAGFQSDVRSYFDTADMFLYASYLDNVPYVLLEAAAHQLPIVATRVGGVAELISAQSVVEPTLEKVVERIDAVLSSIDLRKSMVSSNCMRLRAYSWSKIVQSFMALYGNNQMK